MLNTYTYPKFAYVRPADLDAVVVRRHPVVVVGAGPVGLTVAIDLTMQGVKVLLLDDDETVSVGSRGLCYAKRTLEILDRLGCGEPVVQKGVGWSVGRTFLREDEVYIFNLLPEKDHERPGMINLQQYYLEEYLLKRAQTLGVEVRWKSSVMAVEALSDGARIRIQTPDGIYALEADWLIAADGARSALRKMLGLDVEGKIFQDRFLIADVHMTADFPAERWFWFDPPFHPNQSVLLHREADNVWRIDFQLGWNVDPEVERRPENVIPRIQAMLGKDRPFELEWVSVYTFQCRRMARFRQGRVLFVGDAAHQVSPFGARGANSGVQDADNLVWKLKLVLDGKAPDRLLDTYSDERVYAADENIMNSTRSTDFITPKSSVSKTFRNAVLELAHKNAFARKLVNSGRLSVPAILADSSLNTPDVDVFGGAMVPGAPLDDGPLEADAWLLRQVGGRFVGLFFADDPRRISEHVTRQFVQLAEGSIPVATLVVANRSGEVRGARVVVDCKGVLARRYDALVGTYYLVRPDQHVAARWREFEVGRVHKALSIATCNA